jgi:hypothetical protein
MGVEPDPGCRTELKDHLPRDAFHIGNTQANVGMKMYRSQASTKHFQPAPSQTICIQSGTQSPLEQTVA